MLKWLLAIFLLVFLLAKTPVARWFRLGDLPGDVRIVIKNRRVHLPFTSTLLITATLYLFSRVI